LLALLLTVTLVYANSLENGFHFDDFHTVIDNPAVRSLRNVPRFFTDATTFSVLPSNRTYRPIVSTSLALDYALGERFGTGPYALPWFHASTLVLFLLLIALLFMFYRDILNASEPATANECVALFGAAWFGLHPTMAETVNYIIQRGDLYCTLGCVGALYVFAHWPKLRRTGLYLLPFAFALLSKPPAAVFPALLLLHVYFFEAANQSQNSRFKVALRASVPSLVITACFLALQAAMTPKTFMPSILSPWMYRLAQPYVWLRYVGELFLPLHLNVDTDLQVFPAINLRALEGFVFLAALLGAIWITSRQRRLYPIAYGLLWFVVTQLPTSVYPLSEVENDHRMFFSYVGLIMAAVWAVWLALIQPINNFNLRSKLRPAFLTVALLFLSLYAWGAHLRNAVWKDEETLWRDDVLKSPNNGRGLMIYGLTKMNKGDYTEALNYFQHALLLAPNYPTLEINLGVVTAALADQGDAKQATEAERHFERAIGLAPFSDEPHAYFGRWMLQHGRFTEARKQLEQAVALNPQRVMQRELLISVCEAEGDVEAARRVAESTLAFSPDNIAAHNAMDIQNDAHRMTESMWVNLSLDQYRQGEYAKSAASARNALSINPKSAVAWNNIAAANASLHRWNDAISAAQEAVALKPDFQLAKNNLAWARSQKALNLQ
jgi:tetratricopeptide (TPR) repeat protein